MIRCAIVNLEINLFILNIFFLKFLLKYPLLTFLDDVKLEQLKTTGNISKKIFHNNFNFLNNFMIVVNVF